MKRRGEPLYLTIARELKEEIIHGKYKNDERLPSETTLLKEMGVSRTTIREAVGILEQDGLVNRVHGVGTLITRSRLQLSGGMERLRSFTDSIKEQGMEPGTQYRNFFWDIADEKTARHLEIGEGSHLAVIERVRTGDGRPMIYTIDKIAGDIIGEDFSIEQMGESLFDYLKEEKKVILTDSQLIIRASGAEEEVASFLELKANSPVLSVEETYYDSFEKPILYCINIFRTDRYYFRVFGRSEFHG